MADQPDIDLTPVMQTLEQHYQESINRAINLMTDQLQEAQDELAKTTRHAIEETGRQHAAAVERLSSETQLSLAQLGALIDSFKDNLSRERSEASAETQEHAVKLKELEANIYRFSTDIALIKMQLTQLQSFADNRETALERQYGTKIQANADGISSNASNINDIRLNLQKVATQMAMLGTAGAIVGGAAVQLILQLFVGG